MSDPRDDRDGDDADDRPSPGKRDTAGAGTVAARESPAGEERETGESDGKGGQYERLRTYVNYAVLAGLLFLAFVALLQFYLAASSAITTWVTPDYRAPFRAAFNLVVLLLTGLGISLQLRRLSGRTGSDDEAADARDA